MAESCVTFGQSLGRFFPDSSCLFAGLSVCHRPSLLVCFQSASGCFQFLLEFVFTQKIEASESAEFHNPEFAHGPHSCRYGYSCRYRYGFMCTRTYNVFYVFIFEAFVPAGGYFFGMVGVWVWLLVNIFADSYTRGGCGKWPRKRLIKYDFNWFETRI